MPKMSIRKKQAVVNRNTISRKKLFQFLFKNYIKNAYCGVSRLQPSEGKETSLTDAATTSLPTLQGRVHNVAVHGVGTFSAGKKELRSEYFNDMSDCFTTVSSISRDASLKASMPKTKLQSIRRRVSIKMPTTNDIR